MSLDDANTLATIFGSVIVGLGALWGGWRKWLRPKVHQGRSTWISVRDSLVGREAQHDSITGREIQPALPSLGVRMESMERAAVETNETLKHVVELVRSQQQQDQHIANHEKRITALEDGTIERIAAKAESVAAWRAVEAVAKSAPPDDGTPELG